MVCDTPHPHPLPLGAGVTGQDSARSRELGQARRRRALPGNSYDFHYTSLEMTGSATNLRHVDTVDCFNNLHLCAPHCTAWATEGDCQRAEISHISHRQGEP